MSCIGKRIATQVMAAFEYLLSAGGRSDRCIGAVDDVVPSCLTALAER